MLETDNMTCYNTLTLLILKELRLEKGMHSSQMAEKTTRTHSSWAKIESGKSAFPMDCLYQASNALYTPASFIVATAERYASLLGQHRWSVRQSPLPTDEDTLLKIAELYYGSERFKGRFTYPTNPFSLSIMNTPYFRDNGSCEINDFFMFALDETSKNI